jgi:hypothetical protein
MSGVLSMYESSAIDIIKIDVNTKTDNLGNRIVDYNGNAKQGIALEHGSHLKLQNGIVVATDNVIGNPTNVLLQESTAYNDIVGTAHSHPNEGKGGTILNGDFNTLFNSSGPSDSYDLGSQGSPRQGYYNIVIDKNNVYFYNKDLPKNQQVITLPRAKL